MLFRLQSPWIKARKKILIFLFVDIITYSLTFFSFLYTKGYYQINYLIFLLFLLFFIKISYLLGRYSNELEDYQNILKNEFRKNIFLFINLFLISCISNLISYLFFLNLELGNIYLNTKFIFYFTLISFLKDTYIRKIINAGKSKKNLWIFLGSKSAYKKLLNNIEANIIKNNLIFLENVNDFKEISSQTIKGIIVQDWMYISENQSGQLNLYQKKGLIINSLETWCNINLQRLPPDLVNKDYILSKNYLYKINSFENRLKRLTDVIISTVLLVITSPILIISMLLIYFEDKGPILYSQSRTGFLQRPIKIFKLRTMRIDAENEGIRWASQNDLRITNIGNFLRKTRLDELPQLISVIKGEMSLIGPRPERPEIDIDLANQIPFYNIRYNLKPGLSGWAQVNYPYGASIKDSSIKLSYDIFYLQNFSFFLDFLIAIKTFKLVLFAKGSIPKK